MSRADKGRIPEWYGEARLTRERVRTGLDSMSDTAQHNANGGKGAPSPYEQAQQLVEELTAILKDAQFQKMLAENNEEFRRAEPADSDGELTQEDIAATEQLKAEIREQDLCNYVRGLCRKIIEAKRGDSNSTAHREAVHCLALVQKIEVGDYDVGQELNDAFHIMSQALQAEDETQSRQALCGDVGNKAAASGRASGNGGPCMNVTIQNSNVTMGNIQQAQNSGTGNHTSVAMETPPGESKGNLRKTAAFFAELWACSGWLKPIKAFLHWLGF